MNRDLEAKLFKNYPELFADRKKTIQESCMPWGICCGDGWYTIINILCRQIEWTNKQHLKDCTIRSSQVKEKYGTLRFYYHVEAKDKIRGAKYDKELVDRCIHIVDGMIEFAECLSGITCEHCGSMTDVHQTKGWIVTLCAKCLEKRQKQYAKEVKKLRKEVKSRKK